MLGEHGSPRKGTSDTRHPPPSLSGLPRHRTTTSGSQRQGLGPLTPTTPSGPLPQAFPCCCQAKAQGHLGVLISVSQVCRTGRVHPFLRVCHPPLLPGPEVHPWLGQPLHPWVRLGTCGMESNRGASGLGRPELSRQCRWGELG